MTVRKLDENGDIVTSGVQFLTNRDEIAQTIKTRLRLYLGEYFRDILDGTPWHEGILGKGNPLQVRDSIIKNRISQTDGVINILKYTADYDINTRVYSAQCQVLTEFGVLNLTSGPPKVTGSVSSWNSIITNWENIIFEWQYLG